MGGMFRLPDIDQIHRDFEAEQAANPQRAYQQSPEQFRQPGTVPNTIAPVGGTKGVPTLSPQEVQQHDYDHYMNELAGAYGSAIGADVEKVHVTNPQRFGSIVKAVNLLKGEKIGQGMPEIEAGNAAFIDVLGQFGIEQVKGGIAPGLSLMLTEKELRERPNLWTEAPKNMAHLFARPFLALSGGDFTRRMQKTPQAMEKYREAHRSLGKLPITPIIPETFTHGKGGLNKVLAETVRDFTSPPSIALTGAFPGVTQAGAAVLGRLAAQKGANTISGRALNIARRFIDDGTYLNALKLEAQGELGANFLIRALEDQGVEMNMAQQIGFGLMGGVGSILGSNLATRGIKGAAGQVGKSFEGINLSDLDRGDLSPAGIAETGRRATKATTAEQQRVMEPYLDRATTDEFSVAAADRGVPDARPGYDEDASIDARVDQIIQQYGQRDTSDRFGLSRSPVGMRLRQARARERLRQAGPPGEVDRQAVRTILEAHDRSGTPVDWDWHAALRAIREDPDDVRRAAERALPSDPNRVETAAREPGRSLLFDAERQVDRATLDRGEIPPAHTADRGVLDTRPRDEDGRPIGSVPGDPRLSDFRALRAGTLPADDSLWDEFHVRVDEISKERPLQVERRTLAGNEDTEFVWEELNETPVDQALREWSARFGENVAVQESRLPSDIMDRYRDRDPRYVDPEALELDVSPYRPDDPSWLEEYRAAEAEGRYRDPAAAAAFREAEADPDRAFGNYEVDISPIPEQPGVGQNIKDWGEYTERRTQAEIDGNISRDGKIKVERVGGYSGYDRYKISVRNQKNEAVLLQSEDIPSQGRVYAADARTYSKAFSHQERRRHQAENVEVVLTDNLKEGEWRPVAEYQLSDEGGTKTHRNPDMQTPTEFSHRYDVATLAPDGDFMGYAKPPAGQRNLLGRDGLFSALDKIADDLGPDFVGIRGKRMHGSTNTLAYNLNTIRHFASGRSEGWLSTTEEGVRRKTGESQVKLPDADPDRRYSHGKWIRTREAAKGPASSIVKNIYDVKIGLARSFPNAPIEHIDFWIKTLQERHKIVKNSGGHRGGISEDQWLQERFAGFNTDGLVMMDDGRVLSPSRKSGIDAITFHIPGKSANAKTQILRAIISTNIGKIDPDVSRADQAAKFNPDTMTLEDMTPTQLKLLNEVESMWHELGHVIRRDLYDMDNNSMAIIRRFVGGPDDRRISENIVALDQQPNSLSYTATKKMYDWEWTPEQEEKFARAFVSYLANPGNFDRHGLKSIFANIINWLRKVKLHEGPGTAGRETLTGEEFRAFDDIFYNRRAEEKSYRRRLKWEKTGFDPDGLNRRTAEQAAWASSRTLPTPSPLVDPSRPGGLHEVPEYLVSKWWPDDRSTYEGMPPERLVNREMRNDYLETKDPGVTAPPTVADVLGLPPEQAAVPQYAGSQPAAGSGRRHTRRQQRRLDAERIRGGINDPDFTGPAPATPSESGNTGVRVLDDLERVQRAIGTWNYDSYETVPNQQVLRNEGLVDAADETMQALEIREVRSVAGQNDPALRGGLRSNNMVFEISGEGFDGESLALVGLRRLTRSNRRGIGSKVWELHVKTIPGDDPDFPDGLLRKEIDSVTAAIMEKHGPSGTNRINRIVNMPSAARSPDDIVPSFADRGANFADRTPGTGGDEQLRREEQLEFDVAEMRAQNQEAADTPDFAGKRTDDDATILEDPWARYNEDIKVPEDRTAQALHAAIERRAERLGLEPGDPISVEVEKAALAGTAIPFKTSDRLVREHITPRIVDIINRAGRQTKADIEVRAATARQAAAASANIFRTSALTGEALGKQATGPLKAVDERPLSAYERAPLRGEGADPANALSDADMHLIFESVNRNPRMRPYTKLNTFKAIYKLVDGEHVTKFDIQRLRAVFGNDVTAGLFDNRGFKRKVFDEIMDILGIPRLLLATMDFSAPLRQALLPLGGHPVRWAKTWGPAWKGAISGKYYDEQRAARQAKANHRIFTEPSSPNLPESQRGLGLFETDPEAGLAQSEEAFLSEFLKKLPDRTGRLAAWVTQTPGARKPVTNIMSGVGTVAGYPIRFSERGWSGFLDELRYGLMDDAWESWKRPGSLDSNGDASFVLDKATGDLVPTGQTLKDGRALARYINISTGRGDLMAFEGAAAPLANIFFSPRLMAARFEAPYELIRWDRSKRVKNHIYRDMGGTMAGGATVLGLAAVAGAAVELNATSSDFGRMQVGNTRVDIWGGFQPLVRTIARVAMRERKSTGTGKITDLDKDGIGLVAAEIGNFFRAKLAPVVGFGSDIALGGDFTGDEIDFGPGNRMNLLISRFAPLVAQDLIESYREDGLTGLALAAPSFFGTSVISYQGVEEISRRDYKYPKGHPNEGRPGRKGLANLTDSDHSVFQDLPGFLQDNAIAMNKFEGSQQDSKFSAQIAQIDEDYFTELTGLLDDLEKTDSVKVSGFFAAGNTRADKRAAAFETQYGKFERSDDEPKDDNARAMRSYYDLVNSSVNADKSFNGERFDAGLAEYEASWTEEQVRWVRANTNNKVIPQAMFDILPDKQKINFLQSSQARDELTEIWAKDEAEVNAQIESRRPDTDEVRANIEEGQEVIDSDYNEARIRDGLPPLAGAPGVAGIDEFTTKESRSRALNASKKKLPPPLVIPTPVPKAFDEFTTADTRARATAAAGR